MQLPYKQTVYAQYVRHAVGQVYQGAPLNAFTIAELAEACDLKPTHNFRRQLHGLVADGILYYLRPGRTRADRKVRFGWVHPAPAQELPF